MPERALKSVTDAAMVFEGVATVFACDIEEMPSEAFFVPVAVAEGPEACTGGTLLPGDNAFPVGLLARDVLVNGPLILNLFPLSVFLPLFGLRAVVTAAI